MLLRAVIGLVALGAMACGSTSPDQPETWGSDEASLTVVGSTATLRILASGGCYGSYGEIDHPIPIGSFAFDGTYTELIGAYPGRLEYPAQYSGSLGPDRVVLTVTVPELQRTVGPLTLDHGVTQAWPACQYP